LKLAISEESLNCRHVSVHVTAGAADVHIVAEARRLDTDLIVMAMTSAVETSTPVVSMVGRVARQVACSVLVVPAIGGSARRNEACDEREPTGALNREQLALVHETRNQLPNVGGLA
jgi:hypothetical protein